MSQSLTLPVAGLMTDPGPFTGAPEGGLVEAQNVVIMRPGVIEPRQGNLWIIDAALKAGGYAVQANYVDPSDNGFTWSASGSTWIIRNNPNTITGPSSFERGKVRVCPTGGRALFTSENGVCALPSQAASPTAGASVKAYRAGLVQPYIPIVSLTTTGTIPTGTAIAYRFTVRRTLADGTVVESPPSRRLLVANTSGANAGFFFSGPITPTDPYRGYNSTTVSTNGFNDYAEGDLLCVYRAPSTTYPTVPSDEMRLRATVPWNDTFKAFVDPANPPAPWRDDMPDGLWNGPALYTNETQDGAALANYRPEYARDIAIYNGMTFYAGAKTPHRVVLRNISTGTTEENTSFSYREIPMTRTIGSNIVSGFTAAASRRLRVGQVISGPLEDPEVLGTWPARTYITSVGVGTATVSANALSSAVSANTLVYDYVEVVDGANTYRMYARAAVQVVPDADTDATDFYAYGSGLAYQHAEQQWNGKFTSVGVFSAWRGVQLRISGDSDYSTAAGNGGRDGVWTFTRTDGTDSAFVVRSTCPEAWSQNVTYDVGVTSKRDGGIAELQWSKINEPEHCPLPYRTVVGDAAYAIRRIIPARNSLLILKDDGLFQCFGQTPDALSFELLDRTITLPAQAAYDEQSKWVDRFDDRVVAMTTRGPMVLGDAGGEVIGAPILESLRRVFTASFGALDDALRAMMVDVTGRRVGFIWNIGTPATAVGYIVDMETGTWTYWTWRRQIGAASTRPAPSALGASVGVPISPYALAGGYMAIAPYSDRTMLDDASVTATTMPRTYEAIFSVTPVGLSTCTVLSKTDLVTAWEVVIAAGSEWTPTVGDLLITGGNVHEVTVVDSATTFTVDTEPALGTATWREGYPMRVVWTARAEGNQASEKHWFSAVFPFELTEAVNTMQAVFSGYRNNITVTSDAFEAVSNGVSPWPLVPLYKRVTVPTAIARDWGVKVGFALTRAGSWFSTAGLSMQFAPVAPDKVSR